MNSSPASAKISRSRPPISSRTRVGDLRQALEVQAHAEQLHLAQHRARAAARSRPSPPAGRARRSARAASRRAPPSSTARAATGSSRSLARPRSSQQLRERVAAARRLEQVGAQQRVVRERLGDQPAAPWRRGPTTGRSPQAADDLLGPLARRPRGRARRLQAAKRHGAPSANSSPSGASVSSTTTASSPSPSPSSAIRSGGALAQRGGQRHLGRARRRRHVGVAERLLQAAQRVAQLVLAEELAHPRAVGLAGRLERDVEVDVEVALHGRQLAWRGARPRRARSGSVCAWRL